MNMPKFKLPKYEFKAWHLIPVVFIGAAATLVLRDINTPYVAFVSNRQSLHVITAAELQRCFENARMQQAVRARVAQGPAPLDNAGELRYLKIGNGVTVERLLCEQSRTMGEIRYTAEFRIPDDDLSWRTRFNPRVRIEFGRTGRDFSVTYGAIIMPGHQQGGISYFQQGENTPLLQTYSGALAPENAVEGEARPASFNGLPPYFSQQVEAVRDYIYPPSPAS